MNKRVLAIIFLLAAILYTINIPFSKLLLNNIEPIMMASFLYLGAGLGVSILFLLTKNNKETENEKYTKKRYKICNVNDCFRYSCSNLINVWINNKYIFKCIVIK